MSRWQWLVSRISRQVWFRAVLFCLLGGVTAMAAAFLDPLIPADMPGRIGAQAVDGVLSMIAASMLAVTTFSLSTMVASYAAVTTSTTPRATSLLVEDPTAQNALSTFIGAFLFSVVGIIALSSGSYGTNGRVVLMAVTIVVIALVVAVLIRWIEHLGSFGRVGTTIDRVEQATDKALRDRVADPYLGGTPARRHQAPPPGGVAIHCPDIGYVQHVDIGALHNCAEAADCAFHLDVLPGTFVDPSRPLLWATRDVASEVRQAVCKAISIGNKRTFDQDPRFGLIVLSEIASRALSPGVNDPGTAIDVIGAMVRLLAIRADGANGPPPKVQFPRVHVGCFDNADLFDDVVTPIARDGAAIIEVGIRLQKALQGLSLIGDGSFRDSATRHAALALDRAELALALEADRARLRRLHHAGAEAVP